MREPLLVVFGAFIVVGSLATLLWLLSFERRKSRLGWADAGGTFDKRRRLELALCVVAAVGIFVLVMYGLGLPPGSGRTNELGLILLLVSLVWFVFRRDMARYQYQISMAMFGRHRPDQDQEQRQIRATEFLGTAFSVLLFITGILLLTLNLAFS
jgi:hypothetical protein